jgi:hypothetical protein
MILRQGDYPGLSEWIPGNQKDLYKRVAEGSESEIGDVKMQARSCSDTRKGS